MSDSLFTLTHLLAFSNVAISSIVVILAFSLLAYTFTYNFLSPVARRFALADLSFGVPGGKAGQHHVSAISESEARALRAALLAAR